MYGTAKAGQSKAAQQPLPQRRRPPRATTPEADETATNLGSADSGSYRFVFKPLDILL